MTKSVHVLAFAGLTVSWAGTLAAGQGNPRPPAPQELVEVAAGGESLTIWPYTTSDFQAPSDPINLVFPDADPRTIRQELLKLDGTRPPFASVPAGNCRWTDAMGYEQAAYGHPRGWAGGEVQLACVPAGKPLGDPFRFHVRLFRLGKDTVGAAHYEILIPGSAEHEVLSWDLARDFLTYDAARAGAIAGDPAPVIPGGSFRAVRGLVYKSLFVPLDGEAARAAVDSAMERFRLVEALRGKEEDVLRSVAQEVELRDPYTRGHCDRVADVALKIASVIGMPGEGTAALRCGAWLHDCGKIGVPEAILNHPGKLTPEQFAVVKRHPRWGAEVARDAGLPDGVVDILLHHHERFDGGGYPSGAGGQEIPLAARIVAVADVFDAATADRPYARGYDREEAMRVMAVMRGGAFDPEVVDALFGVLKG